MACTDPLPYTHETAGLTDANPSIVLLNYREDGVTPYVIIWKHGVKETKV